MHLALIYDAVYPFVVGGAERRNYALAKIWRTNHKVAIYGFDYWANDTSRCLPGCDYVPVGPPVPLYTPQGRRRIWEALFFALCLFRTLWRSRERVWDVSNFPYFSVPVAWVMSLCKRRRLVVTWHEFWGDYWYEYLGWKGFLGKFIEAVALRCSPWIVTVSEHTKNRLIAAGYPGERITVIPNGVDLGRIASVPAARESSDLIYIGRLLAHKQVDLVLHALKVLHQTAPQTTLCIVGNGPEKERLVQLTEELGLKDHVHFAGFLPSEEAVYGRLKSARVLVLPSRREGFGMAVIEAWACGIPAVVCDEPGSALPELIDCPARGRVAASNAEAIAAACADLLAQNRQELSDQLSEEAAEFDWQPIAARVMSVYQSCPGAKVTPSRANLTECVLS